MTDHIRAVIQQSPFHGEGHHKIWARLRHQQIRASKQRLLRLMRQAQLLASTRQLAVAEPTPHTGTIMTERPGQMWGTDAAAPSRWNTDR